jgi:phage shock protein C
MSHSQHRSNPHRLYRDKENGRIAGVCAGIADYFGFNRTAIRLLTAFSMLFFWPILIYILLAFLLPVKPAELYENVEQAWRLL